ncbi:MAG: transglycosylase SLT domain-containing protein [Myxococcota bacterium]
MRRPLLIAIGFTCLTGWSAQAATSAPIDHIRETIRSGDLTAGIGALLRLEPSTTDPRARVQARFLLGKLLTEQGSLVGLGYLSALPSPMPEIDDRRLVWLARAAMLRPPDATTASAIQAALPHTANQDERTELLLGLVDVEDALGRREAAANALKQIASGDGPRQHRATAMMRLALREEEPMAERKRRARRLLLHYPDLPQADASKLPMNVEELSDSDRLKRAERLMQRFVYEQARPELTRLAEHPKLGRDARWHLAQIGLTKLRDDPESARKLFKREIALGGPRKEEALFSLIRTHVKEDQYKEALRLGDQYDRRYPNGKFAERIAYYRGWLPYDERNCKRALPHLKRYVKRFGKRRSYVRGFIAWCHIRDAQWKAAIGAFEELMSYRGPLTAGKALYWQAYAFDKLGQRRKGRKKLAALRARYPLTYYDILGQQMLAKWDGRDARASQLKWPEGGTASRGASRLNPEVWGWPNLSPGTAARFARVKALVEVDEVALARKTYRPIREAVESTTPKAKREAFRVAMSFAVENFKYGWKLASGGKVNGNLILPHQATLSWILDYPRAYGPLVERLESRYEVPAEFIYGIMRQESRYKPSAISARDAIGALQMIPQTAILCGEQMGTPYNALTFMDPRVGFPFSAFYMAKHQTKWKGQLLLVAASYNAGPSPVARWLKENSEAPLPFLIEEFSYNEARVYTRQVASHTLRNLWLYEADVARRGEVLDRMFPLDVTYSVDPAADF